MRGKFDFGSKFSLEAGCIIEEYRTRSRLCAAASG